jgi:hypothetical protein
MATPTFTHDLVDWDLAESTTNWVAVGGVTLTLDTDNFVQGAGSIGSSVMTAGTVSGGIFNKTAPVDLTGMHIFVWVLATQHGKMANLASGGLRIRLTGATITNFKDYYIGGRDVVWCSESKWRLVCLDINREPDATGGTPPNINAIQHIGVVALPTATIMTGFILNVDAIRYGTKIAVEGGSDGDPITMQNIFDADVAGNALGIVVKNRSGVFEVNGELRIGDESGSANTVFSSQNEIIVFQDQPCAVDYLKIFGQEDTGTTKIKIGTGSGTGDGRVGLNGSVFDRAVAISGREYSIDLSASDLTLVEVFGSTFLRAKRGVKLPAAAGHEMVSCQFVACGQVDIGQAVTRKCVFAGHGRVTTGAADLDVTANAIDTTASQTIGVTATTRVYTRSAGSFLTNGFAVGMNVLFSGFTNAGNNGYKTITAVDATTMTVAPSTALVTETGTGDERCVVEKAFTRASGSFITDGFTVGMSVIASGFANAVNNDTFLIIGVTATVLVVIPNYATARLTTESGSGDEEIAQSGTTPIGALLWNEDIDIAASSFLGNVQENAGSAGIQHPSAAGTPYTYDDLVFSGNDFDVNNTSGSGITVNKTGISDPSTSKGSSVTFSGSVSVSVTVVDKDNVAIQNAQVSVYKTSDNSEIMNADTNASGVASTSYSGSTPAAVYWRVRKSSTGGTKYKNISGVGTIAASTGMSITVTLYLDPINTA